MYVVTRHKSLGSGLTDVNKVDEGIVSINGNIIICLC